MNNARNTLKPQYLDTSFSRKGFCALGLGYRARVEVRVAGNTTFSVKCTFGDHSTNSFVLT